MRSSAVILLCWFLATACTPPVVHTMRGSETGQGSVAAPSPIAPGEAVIVLKANAVAGDDSHTSCLRKTLSEAEVGLRIGSEKAFRDALFPWFEQPVDDAVIAGLLSRPMVRNKIEQLGIRYLVEVSGETTSDGGGGYGGGGGGGVAYIGPNGAFLCGGGHGAAGCMGLMAWERKSDLKAVVWDLKGGARTATITVNVSGAAALVGFILPVPLIAPTETAACKELGKRVTRFITTGELPENEKKQDTAPPRPTTPPAP